MAAVTLLGTATFNTTAGSKTVTATPAVGDLIVIIAAHTGNTANVVPTDNQGGTYVSYIQDNKASGADTLSVYVRTSLVSSAVSTIYTHAPGTTTGGGLAVMKVTGMSRTGTNAIVAGRGIDSQTAGTTPAPAFIVHTPSSANPIIGAIFNATSPATLTPRTGYTERADIGYSTPTAGLEVMSRDSGETSSTITWGSTSASAYCGMVIELNTAPANTAPSIAQDTADASSFVTTTPTLEFTATDADSDDVQYEIEIDTVNTFNSQTSTATPALVQTVKVTNASATPGTAVLTGVTAGNMITVNTAVALSTTGQVTAVTDSAGNSYSKVFEANSTSGGSSGTQWRAYNVTGGSITVSIAFNDVSTNMSAILQEWSGILNTADPNNGSNTNVSAGSTSVTTGNITTTNANDLLLVNVNDAGGTSQTYTAGTGYVNLDSVKASTSGNVAVESQNVTSTGTYNGAMTIGTVVAWGAGMAAYKAGTSGVPIVDKLSASDAGFVNTVSGGDTQPFTAGQKVSYTVQSALTNGTYYWRVRASDPGGTNTYSSWSATWSFTISAGGTTNTTYFFKMF